MKTSTADAAVRKTVTSDYTLLRRGPRSYVIGTAYRDWTFDAQGEADTSYRWERVFGDLNTCLWIYEGAVAGDGSTSQSCSDTPQIMPVEEFTNGQIGGGTDDGASVATVPGADCVTYDGVHLVSYGNVRPWLVPAVASGTGGGAQRPGVQRCRQLRGRIQRRSNGRRSSKRSKVHQM